MRAVVTGANRGIGLELVRQLAAQGARVEAAAREPERATELRAIADATPGGRVRVHACDVRDDASVRAFAAAVGDGTAVDLLINNAGVMGKMQSLEQLDLDDVENTYQVNALGPVRVTRALLPHLRRGQGKRVAHITSGMGSIGDNTSGGAYGYRMSKAALNMFCKSMAVDLRREGIVTVVINPGWVQTDMGGAGAPTPVSESAAGILRVIASLTPQDSGTFRDYRGPTLPW